MRVFVLNSIKDRNRLESTLFLGSLGGRQTDNRSPDHAASTKKKSWDLDIKTAKENFRNFFSGYARKQPQRITTLANPAEGVIRTLKFFLCSTASMAVDLWTF